MTELMRAEWGCTLKQALFEESLTAALVLWPAMLAWSWWFAALARP